MKNKIITLFAIAMLFGAGILSAQEVINCNQYVKFPNADAGKRLVIWDNGAGGYCGIGKEPYTTTLAISGPSDFFRFTSYNGGGNANELMRLTAGGMLGLGTTNPKAKLEIVSGASSSFYLQAHTSWWHGSGGRLMEQNSSPNAVWVAIKTNTWIMGQGFIAESDARIKNIVKRSEGQDDLATINQLTVTDYKYIDTLSKGNKLAKGFIAQEVEAVIPEAVTTTSEFIPNIYALAQSVTTSTDGNAIVTLKAAHGLNVADEVRLMANAQMDCKVTKVIDAHSFEVSGLAATTEPIFVYGKKVDDFHAVDYDRVFTTGIGAIQQLSKEVEALKAENAHLKAENVSLQSDVEMIKAHLGIESSASR